MGGKHTPVKTVETPGPGSYVQKGAIENMKSQHSKTGFSSSKRQNNHQHASSEIGPGGYDANTENVKYKSPSYGFGKVQGRNDNLDRTAPGPGQYDVSNSNKSKGASIPKANRRPQTANQSTPGPGSYQDDHKKITPNRSVTKGNFGDASRGAPLRNESPGVGAYEDKHHVVKPRSAAFDMGKASGKKQKKELLPGPGQYEEAKKASGPSFAMKSSRLQTRTESSPGPGAYEAKNTLAKIGNGGRGQSKTPRGNLNSKSLLENPGPGNYAVNQKAAGPQYSFSKTTKKQKVDPTPGPGNYNEDFNSIKNKTASVRLGQSERRDMVPQSAREMPGPG